MIRLKPSKIEGLKEVGGVLGTQNREAKKNFITLDDWILSLFVGTLSLKFEGRSLKVILCDPMNGSPINFFENHTSRFDSSRAFIRTNSLGEFDPGSE